MKNGDARSPEWIKRALKGWKRNDETIQAVLCLVSLAPIPSLDEIGTWTDEQCLLATDWAGACHFSASDNNNRVPAMPEHLKPYQRDYPARTTDEVADALVREMAGDNGCKFAPTARQMKALRAGVQLMRHSSTIHGACHFTDAEIDLFAAGEESECAAHFEQFAGFKETHDALCDIFDNPVV